MKNIPNYSKNAERIGISHNYLVFFCRICVNMVHFARYFCHFLRRPASKIQDMQTRSRNAGNRARKFAVSLRSMSATSTCSVSPACAKILPSGETIMLCPPPSAPPHVPQVLQASKKLWFSSARARQSSSQSSARAFGHAAQTKNISVLRDTMRRNCSGNRRS